MDTRDYNQLSVTVFVYRADLPHPTGNRPTQSMWLLLMSMSPPIAAQRSRLGPRFLLLRSQIRDLGQPSRWWTGQTPGPAKDREDRSINGLTSLNSKSESWHNPHSLSLPLSQMHKCFLPLQNFFTDVQIQIHGCTFSLYAQKR